MNKPTFFAVCEWNRCNESTLVFNTPYTLAVWMLGNRWEAAWHYKSLSAEPTFRGRCPKHWSCRE